MDECEKYLSREQTLELFCLVLAWRGRAAVLAHNFWEGGGRSIIAHPVLPRSSPLCSLVTTPRSNTHTPRCSTYESTSR